MRKALKLIGEREQGLGLPTIMDRALAAQHGAPYVQLAVFAIDVDRVREATEHDESLPLGWEIFVTEAYLLRHIDANDEAQRSMLEDACMELLVDQGDPRLGAQLPFAVYDAVLRGALPPTLKALFHRWKTPSKSLLADLAELWTAEAQALPKLIDLCLHTPMTPPLAPPTVHALQGMRAEL